MGIPETLIDQLTDLFTGSSARIFRGDPLDHVEPGLEHLRDDVSRRVADWGLETRIARFKNGHTDAETFIAAPPITDTRAYLAWMHELGHVETSRGRDPRWDRLDAEADAWLWALEHSLVEPDQEDWAYIRDSLESYGRYSWDFGPAGESWQLMTELAAGS